jgi:hypothetical protein
VQKDAREAYENRTAFREVLEKDPEIAAILGDRLTAVLDEAFDLQRAIAHSHRTIDALEAVEAAAANDAGMS